jgi:20S proteasome alpha/beta subunit
MKKIKRQDKRHRIFKRTHREKPMTVCIAAIAESDTQNPKIVIAADREVTTSLLSYTSSVPKIRVLTEYCWVMIATDNALFAQDIITKTIEKINEVTKDKPEEKLSVEQIVELISIECKRVLDTERERVVLSPNGLTYESYIKRSKELSKEHTEILSDDLKNFENEEYNFHAEFLVVGIDNSPHIYTVVQNGQYASSDYEGFAMVGSGKATAFPEFTKYPYRPDSSWIYVLHRVYTSKKVAERVGGVGPDTDLFVLHKTDNGEVAFWPANDDTKQLLDSGMSKVREQESEIYSELLEHYNNLLESTESSTETKK